MRDFLVGEVYHLQLFIELATGNEVTACATSLIAGDVKCGDDLAFSPLLVRVAYAEFVQIVLD